MKPKPFAEQALKEIPRRFKIENGNLIYKIKSGKNKPGSIAGRVVDRLGRRQVHLFSEGYSVNRVAWVLHHGEDPTPEFEVDHKDRDPTNNAKDNLRLGNHQQNLHNLIGRGYTWDKERGKWRVSLQHKGKNYSKRFDTEEEAREWYVQKKRELTGDWCPTLVQNELQDAADKTCSD